MRITKHPFRYNYKAEFQDLNEIAAFEGGAIYKAVKESKFYLIIDEGTIADFFDEDDQDILNQLIKIIEFENEDELNNYLKDQDGRITIFRK